MPVRRPNTRGAKERKVSNRRKPLSIVSASASTVASWHAKPWITDLIVCLGLMAITWAVFGQTLTHDFVNFDDHVYVYENPLVIKGFSAEGMIAAFTHTHARNWHPLTTLSHMLDCQLYGLDAGSHHLTNVILHTISVLLLFLVLKQMTDGLWQSAFVAALFAIHPLHVESVAWIAERKDVLSAVFFMLTLAAYTHYTRAPSVPRYLLVALLFAFGLMSKSMLVTLPFVLLLLDYWPLNRIEGNKSREFGYLLRRFITEKIPLFAMSIFSCIATLLAQRQGPSAIDQLPFLWRLENTFVTYVTYIWQMLWPARLAVFYPHPNDRLSLLPVMGAIALLVAISLVVISLGRTKPYLVTGWFWYLGMLVPVIGLVQVGEQAHADRYTYLPQIGLYIMIAWTVGSLLLESTRLSRAVVGVIAALIVMTLTVCAFDNTAYWKNSQTLWNHALAVTDENDVAHNNLGFLFLRKGELDKAVSEFQAALDIRSGNTQSHYNLGTALVQSNLGNALAREQLWDAAIDHLQEAVRLRPDYGDAYFNLGSVLFQQGKIDQAIAQWQTALAINPRDAVAYRNVADALRKQGKLKEAISEYEQALNIAPEDSATLNNMAWILATSSDPSMRDGARAVALAARAVHASGGRNASFVRTLAAAQAEAGQFAEAAATAEAAKELANTQSKPELARRLDEEISLYRSGAALRY